MWLSTKRISLRVGGSHATRAQKIDRRFEHSAPVFLHGLRGLRRVAMFALCPHGFAKVPIARTAAVRACKGKLLFALVVVIFVVVAVGWLLGWLAG